MNTEHHNVSQAIAAERNRLQDERRRWFEEQERLSISSERPVGTYYPPAEHYRECVITIAIIIYIYIYISSSARSSPAPLRHSNAISPSLPNLSSGGAHNTLSVDSPRQRQYFDELRARGAKIVQSTYDRVGQNHKELTVSRGEYLEVRVGGILGVITLSDAVLRHCCIYGCL
jgi:hypothetical protein